MERFKRLILSEKEIKRSINLQVKAYYLPEKIVLPKEIVNHIDKIIFNILNRFCSCETTMPFKEGKPNVVREEIICAYCNKPHKCQYQYNEYKFEHSAKHIIFDVFTCSEHRPLAMEVYYGRGVINEKWNWRTIIKSNW